MRRRAHCAFFAALFVAGCATDPNAKCQPGERSTVVDSLYFGGAYPDGVITPEMWKEFVDRVVTPRFPQGLTAWEASGQYRTTAGAIQREPSWILQLIHAEGAESDAAVREIRTEYQTQFKQESVLRVRSKACASF